tara:strand:- start:419 stop:787 length:369 start_codon:yes stop_codon:yes gene_type:complete
MSELERMLIEKAHIVAEVTDYEDDQPTIQTKERVLSTLLESDEEFHQIVLDNEAMTFSYGDKFFYVFDDLHYVCIPLGSDLKLIKKLMKGEGTKEFVKAIKKGFKELESQMLKDGGEFYLKD